MSEIDTVQVKGYKKTNSLKPHPLHEEIYGDGADEALIESIAQRGVLVPLLIKADGTIISGHRRWDAAKKLGLEELSVEIKDFADELAEREAVIHSNRNRKKTFSQMMREAEKLEEFETERAKRAQLAHLKQGTQTPVRENFPEREGCRFDRGGET